MQHEAFISGNFDTHFVKHYFNTESLKPIMSEEEEEIAALAAAIALQEQKSEQVSQQSIQENNSWKMNRKTFMKG